MIKQNFTTSISGEVLFLSTFYTHLHLYKVSTLASTSASDKLLLNHMIRKCGTASENTATARLSRHATGESLSDRSDTVVANPHRATAPTNIMGDGREGASQDPTPTLKLKLSEQQRPKVGGSTHLSRSNVETDIGPANKDRLAHEYEKFPDPLKDVEKVLKRDRKKMT